MTVESDERKTIYYQADDTMQVYNYDGTTNVQYRKDNDGRLTMRAHPDVIAVVLKNISTYTFKELPDADDS